MNQIACASQNTEVKILPADVCVFGYFERLSFATVHSPVSQFDSRVKWWIHVSAIVTYSWKKFLLSWNSCKQCSESLTRCFLLTVSKRCTYFEYSFLIDKMANILLSDIFNSSAISRNFKLWSAKMSLRSFLGVFWDNCRIWATWVFSIICVCMTAFQVNIPPLNRCFRWNRVGIILIKPLLRLDSIFSPSESNDLSIHEIQIPSIKSKHLYTSVQIHCFLQP